MTQSSIPLRGGATVGILADLPPMEAGAVLYLRHWFTDSQSRHRMLDDFQALLDPDHAAAAFEDFAALFTHCVRHGRRPLIRHGLGCKCLGADENWFANLIAASAEGSDEDAMMLASLIVEPCAVAQLVELASQCGQTLSQMTRGLPPIHPSRPASYTVH